MVNCEWEAAPWPALCNPAIFIGIGAYFENKLTQRRKEKQVSLAAWREIFIGLGAGKRMPLRMGWAILREFADTDLRPRPKAIGNHRRADIIFRNRNRR